MVHYYRKRGCMNKNSTFTGSNWSHLENCRPYLWHSAYFVHRRALASCMVLQMVCGKHGG